MQLVAIFSKSDLTTPRVFFSETKDLTKIKKTLRVETSGFEKIVTNCISRCSKLSKIKFGAVRRNPYCINLNLDI